MSVRQKERERKIEWRKCKSWNLTPNDYRFFFSIFREFSILSLVVIAEPLSPQFGCYAHAIAITHVCLEMYKRIIHTHDILVYTYINSDTPIHRTIDTNFQIFIAFFPRFFIIFFLRFFFALKLFQWIISLFLTINAVSFYPPLILISLFRIAHIPYTCYFCFEERYTHADILTNRQVVKETNGKQNLNKVQYH